MQQMMNQETLLFIQQHLEDDIRQLAFLGNKYPEVDMPFALDQIQGRQTARHKLPSWAKVDGIVYPPHLSMEQCSSEVTATYKAQLAMRLVEEGRMMPPQQQGHGFTDLTGGFGVDFSFIAATLDIPSRYVERQPHLCEMATENFQHLGLKKAQVIQGDGTEILCTLEKQQLLYLDPARRDDAGNKVVSLHDCTPDVTLLAETLMEKAETVIVKLSPMLDWHKAVNDLHPWVKEVHIVSTQNECKELLLVLREPHGETWNIRVYCINDSQEFSFEEGAKDAILRYADTIVPSMWLFEPNASLMKAGCFPTLSAQFPIKKIAPNSHLFLGEQDIPHFPGRRFCLQAISSLNKKELKQALQGITHANIATRNFPLSVADLRKRLKLKDGGNTYIFATTLANDTHVLLICSK